MWWILWLLLWGLCFARFPYLFIGFASLGYLLGFSPYTLNLLVTFPIGIIYAQKDLLHGRPPLSRNTIILEFFRWIWVGLGDYLELIDSQSRGLAGYAYVTLLIHILSLIGWNVAHQMEWKYRFYVAYTVWLMIWTITSPYNFISALLTHALNVSIDFRLVDLL